jgi:hypothetical protein
MATYKQLKTSSEARLWLGQIIIPVVTAGIMLVANPDVRHWVKSKFRKAKNKLKEKKELEYEDMD